MHFYLRTLSYFRRDLPLIVASLGLIGISTLAGAVAAVFGGDPARHHSFSQAHIELGTSHVFVAGKYDWNQWRK